MSEWQELSLQPDPPRTKDETIKQTTSMVKAALREEALTRVLEYYSWGKENLEAPEFWQGVPDAMNILRDIFRGYVLAGERDFMDGGELNWSEVGLEADRLLLDTLEEIEKKDDA